jgi:hypothetical protein
MVGEFEARLSDASTLVVVAASSDPANEMLAYRSPCEHNHTSSLPAIHLQRLSSHLSFTQHPIRGLQLHSLHNTIMPDIEVPDPEELGGNVTKPFKFVTGTMAPYHTTQGSKRPRLT